VKSVLASWLAIWLAVWLVGWLSDTLFYVHIIFYGNNNDDGNGMCYRFIF